jgi:hypothetical protein
MAMDVIGSRAPAAGFKFNSFEEIKSHSSILYNERLAILFYMLDMRSINMNTNANIGDMLETRAILKQIYKNTRMLIRYNPTCRATLNLDTKDDGIYVPDVALSTVDKMIEHCEVQGYTTRKLYIIIQEINRIETLIKDILQYFHYFIRPDFRQKPDIEIATEQYKEIADSRTIDELRALVGRNAKVDFEGLGSSRIELNQPDIDDVEAPEFVGYDPSVDGDRDEKSNDGPGSVQGASPN